MGYIVENYDLDSLREFSNSHFSISSIFAVIPLSTWSQEDLELITDWFIEDPVLSKCGTIILDHFNKKTKKELIRILLRD